MPEKQPLVANPGASAERGRYLLITSDDLGMCHAVNTGIVRAMTEGAVTSSALLVPCPWFAEAVHLVKQHALPVGVHLCLTCDWDRMKWGPITNAPSLIGSDGNFLATYDQLASVARDEDVLQELNAQIDRVRAQGITPTHVDIHMLGGDDDRPQMRRFLDLIQQVCARQRLIYTRDFHPGSGLVHLTDQIGSSGLAEPLIWEDLQRWTSPGIYHIIAHVAAAHPELEALCSADHPAQHWAAPYRVADAAWLTRPSTRRRLSEMGFERIDVPRLLALRGLGGSP